MLYVIKRKDGTIEVHIPAKVEYKTRSIIYSFEEPIRVFGDDEMVSYSSHNDIGLLNYIPEERKFALKRFVHTGEASEDFMNWLESNGVARHLVELHLRHSDDLVTKALNY